MKPYVDNNVERRSNHRIFAEIHEYGNKGNRMTIVAIITIRRGAIQAFREYEGHAAAIMAEYGGRIERTVFIPAEHLDADDREVHVLTFPNVAAFVDYRNDERLMALADLRNNAITATEILIGHDGPTYGP